MKILSKYISIILILFGSFHQGWSQEKFLNFSCKSGYSMALNSEIPEVYYETGGKASYNFGFTINQSFGKFDIGVGLSWLNLGYSVKKTEGFTPSNIFSISEYFPIYFFENLNYNYNQLAIESSYKIDNKLKIGLGIYPSMKSGKSIVIKREALIAGQQDNDIIYGSGFITIYNYDDMKKYNIFSSIFMNYKLYDNIYFDLEYSSSLIHFNKYDVVKKMYHQNFSAGITYLLILTKK
jgi:hypothetical protein